MQRKQKRAAQWLLPTALVLFILEVLMLPVVLEHTYAGRGEGPNHILTYSTGALAWDEGTDIDEDGVAVLDLFDTVYDNVNGQGDKVVAPGTAGSNLLRLKNDSNRTVTFTAVLYRIRTSDAIRVEPALAGEALEDTADYYLPENVAQEHVIRAVTGELQADRIQDLEISWQWTLGEGEEQNAADTLLGNAENDDQVTVGVYIVVEDGGQVIEPDPPTTGDRSYPYAYLTLMAISLVVLILLLWDRRREKA